MPPPSGAFSITLVCLYIGQQVLNFVNLYSNLNLPQPNVMNNAYYHKIQINLDFLCCQFLYARQKSPVKFLTGCNYGMQMSGVRLSSVSHRNLRTTCQNFMKLDPVVPYNGQTICILFGEKKIKRVTGLCI